MPSLNVFPREGGVPNVGETFGFRRQLVGAWSGSRGFQQFAGPPTGSSPLRLHALDMTKSGRSFMARYAGSLLRVYRISGPIIAGVSYRNSRIAIMRKSETSDALRWSYHDLLEDRYAAMRIAKQRSCILPSGFLTGGVVYHAPSSLETISAGEKYSKRSLPILYPPHRRNRCKPNRCARAGVAVVG